MNDKNLSYLFTPSRSPYIPPLDTLLDELPLSSLFWEDFEKLCLALVEIEYSIDDCEIYGIKGQAQFGIDIYARKISKKYSVYQCKRYEKFTSADLQKAVNKFEIGKWASESEEFYLCTSTRLNDTEIQDSFNLIKSKLASKSINFIKWDAVQINRILKDHPFIVYKFFGESWVKSFNGEIALMSLKKQFCLDAHLIIDFRKELHVFYSTVFNTYDPGFLSHETNSSSFSLQERFIVPDVLTRKYVDFGSISEEESIELKSHNIKSELLNQLTEQELNRNKQLSYSIQDEEVRSHAFLSNIDDILPLNNRNIILGEPGSGKSTLLRCIILDLLSSSPKLINLSKRWGSSLPVWMPFAFLTKNLLLSPNISISEMLRLWFKSHDSEELFKFIELALKDKRLILFVDGLDEWSNLDAANQVITKIEIQNNLHQTKIVYSSRPYGFRFLQDSIKTANNLTLSPFSPTKQFEFIYKWIKHWHLLNIHSQSSQKSDNYIKHQAESFHREINNSEDLKQLAQYPLLLNILLHQKLRDSTLSRNKINALNEISSYLINKHPLKRKVQANIIEEDSMGLNEYLEDLFSELALEIFLRSGDGIIIKSDAENIVETYLSDSLGFDKNRQKVYSTKVIEIGANSIGIIIERSPEEISFVHRQFLEFLVAKCLVSSDKSKTENIIREFCLNPLWYQVIIYFFALIPNKKQEEFQEYYNLVNQKDCSAINLYNKKCLLNELTLNSINCPVILVKSNYEALSNSCNFETDPIYKRRLLEILMDGINNPKISDSILEYSKSYLPGLYHFHDPRILSLKNISKELITLEIIEFFKLTFTNGSIEEKLDASEAIKQFISIPELRKFIDNIIENECDLLIRAFAINTLLTNEVQNETIDYILSKHEHSKDTFIALFYVRGKIFLGSHTSDDLDKLLHINHNFSSKFNEVLLHMFLEGWGKSIQLKKICFSSVQSRHFSRFVLNQDLAWRILFHSYNDDKEVINRIIIELETEKYPFLTVTPYNGWQYIAKYFRNNIYLAPVIDKWILTQEFRNAEIAYASIASGSQVAKNKLLEMLPTSSVSHWEVMGLLEGWKNDKEVIFFLKQYFKGSNPRKSMAAGYISKIFQDEKVEAIKILEEILFDESFPFRERAISPLIDLDKVFFESSVLNRFLEQELPTLSKNDAFNQYYNTLFLLASHYYHNKRIQQLILQDQKYLIHYFDLMVLNEKVNSPRINSLLKNSLPLSSDLKRTIFEKLSPRIPFSNSIYELFFQFTDESNKDLQLSIAISLFRHLNYADPELMISICYENAFYRGTDFKVQRQISFVGYLLNKKLNQYFKLIDNASNDIANPSISFYTSYEVPNIDLVQVLIENFEYLYTELEGDWKKLSIDQYAEDELPWAFFAKYSDSSSPSFNAINKYIMDNASSLTNIEFLIFLNRTRPQSNTLKILALKFVSTGNNLSVQTLAGTILGLNFKNDSLVKNQLLLINQYTLDPGKIIALCIGWPNEPQLKRIWEDVKNLGLPSNNSAGYYLKFLFRDDENIMQFIVETINSNELEFRHQHFLAPFLRKLSVSDKLISKIKDLLFITNDLDQKVSLYCLLKHLGKLNPEILEWRNKELLSVTPIDHGYDIVSNTVIPLSRILLNE